MYTNCVCLFSNRDDAVSATIFVIETTVIFIKCYMFWPVGCINTAGCHTLNLRAVVMCFRSWWPWNTFTVRTLCTVISNQRMSSSVLTLTSLKWSSVTLALLESLVRNHFDALWLAHLPILVSCTEKKNIDFSPFISFVSLSHQIFLPFFSLVTRDIHNICFKVICLTEFSLSDVWVVQMFLV